MNRLATFSKKQVAAVDLGVELYKHYLFEKENTNGRNNRFTSFARTTDESGRMIPYADKNKIFHNMMVDEAYEISGINKERFSVESAFTFQTFERAFFSVLEETLNKVNAKTEIESALGFAEVKSMAEGDSLTFHIPSNHLLAVSTVANGVRSVHFQTLWEDDFTITPKTKKAGIKVDVRRIATGMYDWGWLINQIIKSFRTKQQQEVIDMVYGGFTSLGTNFKENTFAQDSYIRLAERVSAANGSPVTTIGTKTALGKVLPTSDYFKMELGREYVDNGYIQSPFGIPTIKLEQSIKPNSAYDFAIDNNYIVLISSAVDRIIKLGTEGNMKIRQSRENENADDTMSYTITDSWDMVLASQSFYGMVKVG